MLALGCRRDKIRQTSEGIWAQKMRMRLTVAPFSDANKWSKSFVTDIEILAVVLIRVLAVGFVTIGIVQASANVLDSITAFQPEHLRFYLRVQLLRPAVLSVAGFALLMGSRYIGASMVHGLTG